MTKINITYVDACSPYRYHYVYVRVIRPPKIVGHQALKNIDWFDRDYWPDHYAYYRQVTERQIRDKYLQINLYNYESTAAEEERAKNKEKGVGIVFTPTPMPNVPLRRIPIAEES